MAEKYPKQERNEVLRLRTLAATGQFVFHGSGVQLACLEPRQAISHGKPDGEPAVCAASDPDTAIFMAIMDSAKRMVLANGESCKSGYTPDRNGDRFYATTNLVEAMRTCQGWVHVLSRDCFKPYYGEEEMRSSEAVSPLETVAVTLDDFRYPIETIAE